MMAAAKLGEEVRAVVSRGGRPDLAGSALPLMQALTLLIVGGCVEEVLRLNEDAYAQLHCETKLEVVPGRRTCSKSPPRSKRSHRSRLDGFRNT